MQVAGGLTIVEDLIELIGYRTNRLQDGHTGEWIRRHRYVKFPADSSGADVLRLFRDAAADAVIVITSTDGNTRELDASEYDRILMDVYEYAEMKMEHLFRHAHEEGTDGQHPRAPR